MTFRSEAMQDRIKVIEETRLFIERVCESIADNPKLVFVEATPLSGIAIFNIKCDPDDTAKLIGDRGATFYGIGFLAKCFYNRRAVGEIKVAYLENAPVQNKSPFIYDPNWKREECLETLDWIVMSVFGKSWRRTEPVACPLPVIYKLSEHVYDKQNAIKSVNAVGGAIAKTMSGKIVVDLEFD